MDNNYNYEDEISLGEIFKIIKPYILSLVIITISVMAAVFVGSKLLIKPTYESRGQLFVENVEVSKENIELILKSDELLAKVKANLESQNIAFVSSRIKVNNVDKTDIFRFTYQGSNNTEIQTALNEMLASARMMIIDTYPQANASIINEASLASSPLAPNVKMNALVAGMLAFMVAIGYIFIRYFTSDANYAFESSNDYLNSKIISAIPSLSAEVKFASLIKNEQPVLNIPVVNEDYSTLEYYRLLKSHLIHALKEQNHKAFMFASLEDDEGRKEVVLSTVKSLVLSDYKVLLFTTNGDNQFAENLDEAIVYNEDTGCYKLNYDAYRYHNESVSSEQFVNNFRKLKEDFDFIIIDAQSLKDSSVVYEISALSDAYYFVVRQQVSKRKDVKFAIENLSRLGHKLLGIILVNS